jgi:hypothetical protein
MGKSKPKAAAALERDGKRVEPSLEAERHRHHGHIRQSVQPDDRPQDRAGIAPRLEGVDPPMIGGPCEELGILPGMGPDIKDDGGRRHEPRDRRGERAVMLLGRRLQQVSQETSRRTPMIRTNLQGKPSLDCELS